MKPFLHLFVVMVPFLLLMLLLLARWTTDAWIVTTTISSSPRRHRQPPSVISSAAVYSASPSSSSRRCFVLKGTSKEEDDGDTEEWSDFDDLGYSSSSSNSNSNSGKERLGDDDVDDKVQDDDDDTADLSSLDQPQPDFAKLWQERTGVRDLSAIQTRQFRLGPDLILSDYVGNMGFDEVTDWEYYYPSDEDDNEDRQVVQPNPFDSSKPRRTRVSSGSVVRIFRGEFVGQLGGTLSAQGQDRRVLVKEFTGDLALALAKAELEAVGILQSELVVDGQKKMNANDGTAERGEWIQTAASRSVQLRQDNAHVTELSLLLENAPHLGILGEVNLAELEGSMEPNEFYRALGVPPPGPDAVWVVYEYAGLSTVQAYALPAQVRRASLPPQKGFFGNVVEPPQLPPWKDRANYVVKGIMKGAILALATAHESGIVHRSIGRNSILITTKAMDKREAISPFNTLLSNLRIKLSDFGFSGLYQQSTFDEEFCTRARSFGLRFRKGDNNIATANFAIAEDMHALGFVFLGLLLTSLAELPNPQYQMPATDEDTLQRLLGDIFEKDFEQFREYVEAEDIWSKLVELLDENDGAGWKVLETLVLAREKAAKNKETSQMFTVRGLLANPLFAS